MCGERLEAEGFKLLASARHSRILRTIVLVEATASRHVRHPRKVKHMTTRTVGGWALLVDAALTLVLLITMSAALGGATLFLLIGEALSLLYIVGLVAVWLMLPRTGRLGRIGQIGLWCLSIAAAIAFGVRLALLVGTVDVAELVPFSSALFGLLGGLLVGWVTIRTRVFHPVIGWLLIVSVALNLVGGLLPTGIVASAMSIVGPLAQAGAVSGYGWTMLRADRGVLVTRPAPVESR